MSSYLARGPKIYPKAHENPRAFSCIYGLIFLESPSHDSSDGSPPWEDYIIVHDLFMTYLGFFFFFALDSHKIGTTISHFFCYVSNASSDHHQPFFSSIFII